MLLLMLKVQGYRLPVSYHRYCWKHDKNGLIVELKDSDRLSEYILKYCKDRGLVKKHDDDAVEKILFS